MNNLIIININNNFRYYYKSRNKHQRIVIQKNCFLVSQLFINLFFKKIISNNSTKYTLLNDQKVENFLAPY